MPSLLKKKFFAAKKVVSSEQKWNTVEAKKKVQGGCTLLMDINLQCASFLFC